MDGEDKMKRDELISEVFIETMCDMAFVDLIPQTEIDINNPIANKMRILLPYLGDVILIFSGNLANQLSMNLHEDKDHVEDSINEFLNIFTGKLLERLHPDVLFELGLPEASSVDEIDDKEFEILNFGNPDNDNVCVYHQLKNLKD